MTGTPDHLVIGRSWVALGLPSTRLLNALDPRSSPVQSPPGGRLERCVRPGDVGYRPELGRPGIAVHRAAHVAAAVLLPLDVWIVGTDRGRGEDGRVGAVAARADARADELRGDRRLLRATEVRAQLVDPARVDVAGEHDGAVRGTARDRLEETGAGCRIPAPLIHRHPLLVASQLVVGRDHDLVGEDSPS